MTLRKLSKKEKNLLPSLKKKWNAAARNTSPADRKIAEDAIVSLYSATDGFDRPDIIWAESPLTGAMIAGAIDERDASSCDLISEVMRIIKGHRFCDDYWDSIQPRINAQISANRAIFIKAQIKKELNGMGKSVKIVPGDDVGRVVGDLAKSIKARKSAIDYLELVYCGQDDSKNIAATDYIANMEHNALMDEERGALVCFNYLCKYALSAGWAYLHKNFCVLCERHNVYKTIAGASKGDRATVIQYPDGFAVYVLNGVVVPREIVEKPGDELSAELIVREKNAEVRRAIINKIGIERVCIELNATVVNKYKNYELIVLEIGAETSRPYLKMINPSTGTYHIEGVPPDCKTVKAALAFRNKTNKRPKTLT